MPEAYAHTNIALVKYWGKRDAALNLPAVGSLSLTLDAFGTWTSVTLDSTAPADGFTLDGVEQTGAPLERVRTFLDLMRQQSGRRDHLRVQSRNDVPTASGLASSASGCAALTVAAARALEWDVDATTLSALARRGSGSAARSVWGGFVRVVPGSRVDGVDCVAAPLPDSAGWDIKLVVATCAKGAKDWSSSEGMIHTQQTSPFYPAWVQTHAQDLDTATQAVQDRNLQRLGEVMEHSTLKMHACTLAATPGVLYWQGVTVEVAHAVRALRRQGTGAWFTMDAGPHVKVLCAGRDATTVSNTLRQVPGVLGVNLAGPGPAARLLS